MIAFQPAFRALVSLAALLVCISVYGQGTFIDHKFNFDNSGIWKRSNQLTVVNGLVIGTVAGALWEGGESRLGRTFWQSVDSFALGAVSSETLKQLVQRARPAQSNDPDEIRQGKGHYSFPSGEVTAVTAVITPFVLEYGHDHSMVFALYALPAYDAVARLKSQAHWQTDVIAGFALGTLTGYYAQHRDSPLILGVLPHGFTVGTRVKF